MSEERGRADPLRDGDRLSRNQLSLRADCSRCFGLCCVAPAFTASADFAIDKAAGQACPNLRPDSACGIHPSLRQLGFRGCTVYDCFGAGQQVAQVTFRGQDWRQAPQTAQQMFDVFAIMRHLHELLWYLTEALTLSSAGPLHGALRGALEETGRLTAYPPADLVELDVAAHREPINALLQRTSELVRADVDGPKIDRSGADLIGADLRDVDLRGANLRGTYLIAADLRAADLGGADLTGADCRDADLRGADLAGTVFLTQSQLDAAIGDQHTRLPASLTRPTHWSAEQIRSGH